jgi:hypothetical protein
VRDIEIQRRENDLVLGTFGRGFYVLDDYSPLRLRRRGALERSRRCSSSRVKALRSTSSAARLGGRPRWHVGSQGSTFFTAPNPPFGAILTYYLRGWLADQEGAAGEGAGQGAQGGETLPYPDDRRAARRGRRERSQVILDDPRRRRRRRASYRPPRKKGMHRVAWDLRYPGATPITLGRDSGRGGPLVLSGRFSASLEQEQGGIVSSLVGPVWFDVEALNFATLQAEDKAEVLAFQKDVVELRRAVRASIRVLGEVQSRVDHARVAVRRTPGVDLALLGKLASIDMQLAELRRALSGDRSLSRRNKPSPMSISERINNVASAQLRTSSAPTQTERDAYRHASEAFAPVLTVLRKIATQELVEIEEALELAGAGDTPGRLPRWQKK